MRGAAIFLAAKAPSPTDYDGVITSGLMSLSDFKALSRTGCPPVMLYLHENQLSYPLAPGERRDFQYGYTDITSALSADCVRFNSRTHYEQFFARLAPFLKMMPDYRPNWILAQIRSKSDVLYPGCDFPTDGALERNFEQTPVEAPLIIWNHRWEHDKNPAAFFQALEALESAGLPFRLAILGERFQSAPPVFAAARERFADRIVQYGYVPDRSRYRSWLQRADIVISTADQENFGMAVVEAVRYGCLPLLPDRLAYPEILPAAFHEDCLYRSRSDLAGKLCDAVGDISRCATVRRRLSDHMRRYAWQSRIHFFDAELERLPCQGSPAVS